jgi:hypothetical protein
MNIEFVEHVYYWNARFKGKTALLAGPFLTPQEAEATADFVSPVFLLQCPEAVNATFGVMQCNAPGAGEGRYNEYLPNNLLGNLAIDTRLRSN